MPQRHNQDSHKPLARDARLPKNHRPPADPRSLASVRGSAATKQKRMGGEARVGRLAGALDPPRPGRRGRRGGCCGGGARGASRDTEPRQKNRRQTQGMGQGRGEGGRGGEAARARSHETTHCSFCCCCCCPYPPPPPPSGGGLAPARRLGCGSTTSMIFRAYRNVEETGSGTGPGPVRERSRTSPGKFLLPTATCAPRRCGSGTCQRSWWQSATRRRLVPYLQSTESSMGSVPWWCGRWRLAGGPRGARNL